MRAADIRDHHDGRPRGGEAEEAAADVSSRRKSGRDREATAARVAALDDALGEARRELALLEARAASPGLIELEVERLRAETAKAESHFTAMKERVARAREKLAELDTEAAQSGPPLERLPPEAFEHRSVFFDAAAPYTEFLCAQLGSARCSSRRRTGISGARCS